MQQHQILKIKRSLEIEMPCTENISLIFHLFFGAQFFGEFFSQIKIKSEILIVAKFEEKLIIIENFFFTL